MADVLADIQGMKEEIITIKNTQTELIKYLLERFPPIMEEVKSTSSDVREWLNKTSNNWEKNETILPLDLNSRSFNWYYYTITLAPDNAIEFIKDEIKQQRFKSCSNRGWHPLDSNYNWKWDPQKEHIIKLFDELKKQKERSIDGDDFDWKLDLDEMGIQDRDLSPLLRELGSMRLILISRRNV